MADNEDGAWVVLALGALAMYSCSSDDSDSDADQQYIVDELGVSDEVAANLLQEYGSPEDAVDDFRDAYDTGDSDTYPSGYTGTYDAYREPFDEYAARSAAEDELASEGYDYSYGCTDDCSGHEAGWQWRAGNGYTTPGNSNSFDEGGQAFDDAVESRVDEMRNDYESSAEPY